MKDKRTIGYLLFYVLVFAALFFASWGLREITLLTQRNYQIYLAVFAYFTIPLLFGMLIGSESLFKEFKKEGDWTVNVQKLIILGILPLVTVIYYWTISGRIPLIDRTSSLVFNGPAGFCLAGVLSGYSLITSFYKKSEIPAKIEQKAEI